MILYILKRFIVFDSFKLIAENTLYTIGWKTGVNYANRGKIKIRE